MFVFDLKDNVVLVMPATGLYRAKESQRGQIVGRAEFINASNNYLVRYRDAKGNPEERWWTEDALETAPPFDAET